MKKERGRPAKKAPEKAPEKTRPVKKELEIEQPVEAEIEKEPEAELVDEQEEQVNPEEQEDLTDENDEEDARDVELNADIKDERAILKEIGMTEAELTDNNEAGDKTYNPLRPNVIKRNYADGNPDGQSNQEQQQQQQQEEQVADDGDIPSQNYEEIAEPHYTINGESGSGAGKEEEEDNSGDGGNSGGGKSADSGGGKEAILDGDETNDGGDDDSKGGSGDSDKPTKAELKREAEKTADVILDTAEQLLPVPLMAIASYDMAKMSNLDMKDEIDLGMQVRRDGTTVESFMLQHNEKCEAIFQISPQEREVIREPLIDVILEKEATLSPMARLGIAIGGVMLTKLYGAIKLATENRESLKTFKEFREEDKLKEQDRLEQEAAKRKVVAQPVSQPTATQTTASKPVEKKEEKPLVMEDVLNEEEK